MKFVAVLVFDDIQDDEVAVQSLMRAVGTSASYIAPQEPVIWVAIRDRAEEIIGVTTR